jgi:hypothetical protein
MPVETNHFLSSIVNQQLLTTAMLQQNLLCPIEENSGVLMSSVLVVSHEWVRSGEKGSNGNWVRGPKMRQLILSKGPASTEVCNFADTYKELPFQVRGLFL